MNVGLFGFGRAGRSVASVLLESKKTNLRWVIRQTNRLNHRSVPEFLGIESDEPGLIFSKHEFANASALFDQHPIEAIVDFASESGIDFYGEEAAKRGITIVSAVSHYEPEKITLLKKLSQTTRVLWSPNITVGINFLLLASKTLKQIAPYADIEIIEEHFSAKPEVSGTAKFIAKELDKNPSDIKVIRAGGIVGHHQVLFGFPYQTVRLCHDSISREAFGNGALFALEQLKEKPIGFYNMQELMMPFFNHQ